MNAPVIADPVLLPPASQPAALQSPASATRPLWRIERADIAVIEAMRPWFGNPLVKAAGAVAKIGDEPPVLALCGATLLAGLALRQDRLTRAGLRMTLAQLVAIGIKSVGKNYINRTRPSHMLDTGEYLLERGCSSESERQSLPSGHTAGAFAIARAASREFPGARVALQGAAATVGALQLPRRAHFPTDIIAGAVIGIAAEAMVNLVWRRLTK